MPQPKPDKPRPIRLRVGDTVEGAASLHDLVRGAEAKAIAKRRVKRANVYTIATPTDRIGALEVLYYIESSPAFLGLDGADMTERSACVRTSAAWRRKLGLNPHEEIPVPKSAGG